GTDRACKARPVEKSQDDGNGEIDEKGTPGDRHDGRHGQPQRNARQRLQYLDDPLNDEIDNAAFITGNSTDDDAENKAHADSQKTDRQRHPRAIDDAREHVAAKPVGAEEEELAAFCGAEQMEISLDEPPEAVGLVMAKEADRLNILAIVTVLTLEGI